MRELVTADDAILTCKAKPVKIFALKQLRRLFDDMWETMDAHHGQGLAAPQIGISQRIIIARYGKRRVELINPRIIKCKPPFSFDTEECLSLPGIHANVCRASGVLIEGLDATGKKITVSAVDTLARCLQHEIDHLDGILITQSGYVLPTFQNSEASA